MRIVFWQNLLSPHQLPYITHMLDDKRVSEVIIVVGEDMDKNREKMGWKIPQIEGLSRCKIVLNPQENEMNNIFSQKEKESWHLFSGIRGFKFVFNAFKISLNYQIKRGLITERPYTFAFGHANGKPLLLHKIRFLLQDRKYARYIDKVFAMGDDAVSYFQKVYSKWDVIPFAYCTEPSLYFNHPQEGNTKFCFSGSLSTRKAPQNIVKAGILLNKEINISYIGAGNKEVEIKSLIKNHKQIHTTFYGFQDQTKIPELLSTQDVLILPSIYDGWGAVVNEALQAGLYVICSNKCGAKELLKNPRCGKVFQSENIKDLASLMKYCIDNIETIRKDRSFRKEWANTHISGRVIAQYMIDCLHNIPATRPWYK